MARKMPPAGQPCQHHRFRPEHASAIARELQRIASGEKHSLDALPADHPRRRPSLAKLRFMEGEGEP